PRLPGRPQADPQPGGAAAPRLRSARGREGGRRAGPGPPNHASPGAVGAACARRGGCPGVSGLGGDAPRGLSPQMPAPWATTTSGRLAAYLGLGGAGLLAGLLLSRPEPVILAAPLLLAAAVGLALARPPRLEVDVRLDRERALEGEQVELEVEVRALRPVARLEVEIRLPAGLVQLPPAPGPASSLAAGGAYGYHRRLLCWRWGGRLVGEVRMRARDRLGFFTYREEERHLLPLRVYPPPDELRRLVRPAETQAFVGNEVSRLK